MDDANSRPRRRDELARMRADAVLPGSLRPERPAMAGPASVALLTGACGFLGRQVARELLRDPDLRLVCLARDKHGEAAADRVARILASAGVDAETLARRVEVVTGDVARPDLGLDAVTHAGLAARLDTIHHCAARVDWVRGYAALHAMNVGSVLNLIRLACAGRAKRLVFVSSLAVCYARGGPARIDEDTDMLPHIAGMPLGYARGKCVAESLLRQAAARGVPVTILRPALISGDAASGQSNPADLIAALIQGCVATGMAIDTDWLLDCVPVDFVARAMARVPQGGTACRVLNLPHGRPRHWRELILWMNLHGYPVRLVDAETWVRRVFDEGGGRGTQLYAQRQFFRGRAGGERPYQVYLAAGQERIDSTRTRALLDDLDLREAALDADLLHGYFADYRRAGVLPARAGPAPEPIALGRLLAGPWRRRRRNGGARPLAPAMRRRIGADDGLLSEIAAASEPASVGLWRLDMPAGSPLVLKAKAGDVLVQDLTARMAGLCRPALGTLFERFRDVLGLAGSHARELALYESRAPFLRRHMPECLGTLSGLDGRRWGLLLEYLPEAEGAGAGGAAQSLRADAADMLDVVAGLAEIHAAWYRCEAELLARPWLSAPPDSAGMLEMTPLWRELADFAAPWFAAWCGPEIRALQDACIAGLPDWWPRLRALPATLIHNDFNPRNLVLRRAGEGAARLCVYDWELATLGAPQRDLAELLCFTWRAELPAGRLDVLLEAHRRALIETSGHDIDPRAWQAGFALALRHLLIERFAMYTLMHRFRPLAYLPGVMANWMRLHALSRRWATRAKRDGHGRAASAPPA